MTLDKCSFSCATIANQDKLKKGASVNKDNGNIYNYTQYAHHRTFFFFEKKNLQCTLLGFLKSFNISILHDFMHFFGQDSFSCKNMNKTIYKLAVLNLKRQGICAV